MSTMPTSEQSAEAPLREGRRFRWLWLVALIIVLVLGGVALSMLLTGDGQQPTLTFDGESLVYTGPEAFDDRLITFNLENTSDQVATFAWGVIDDDTVTEAQHLEWAETHRNQPPWLGMWYRIGVVGPGAAKEASITAMEGRIDLTAWGENTRTYVAGIFEVAAD